MQKAFPSQLMDSKSKDGKYFLFVCLMLFLWVRFCCGGTQQTRYRRKDEDLKLVGMEEVVKWDWQLLLAFVGGNCPEPTCYLIQKVYLLLHKSRCLYIIPIWKYVYIAVTLHTLYRLSFV